MGVCESCKYYQVCGSEGRTESCAGKEFKAEYRAGEVKWSKLVFYRSDGRVDRVILRKDLELMSKEQRDSLEKLLVRSTDTAGTYAVV